MTSPGKMVKDMYFATLCNSLMFLIKHCNERKIVMGEGYEHLVYSLEGGWFFLIEMTWTVTDKTLIVYRSYYFKMYKVCLKPQQ